MTREKASTPAPNDRRKAELREIVPALQTRVDAMGLRRVAREVGITPTGLKKILVGSNPYQYTHKKLVEWFTRHCAGQYDTARDTALDVLLQGIPPSERKRVRNQILAILRIENPRARPSRKRPFT